MSYTELLAVWTGASGLPGYTKMRWITALDPGDLNAAAANFRVWLLAMAAQVPSNITIAIQSGASVHDDDGTLQSELTIGTVPAAVAGGVSATYASPVGLVVLWNTSAINGGKKVRGRSYIVPLATSAFQNDGSLATTYLGTARTASNDFALSTPSPAVNSRARPGNPAAGNQTVSMTGATIPDKAAILRSRRD